MKTILCYGDSNTWGYIPGTGSRFSPEIRWPGVLQRSLGSEYKVEEAGLNGRTTIWDDPFDPWRNGRDGLIPALRMAAPLDLVILMLGTNDLKWHNAWESARGCKALITAMQEQAGQFSGGRAEVLLVSPPEIVGPLSPMVSNPEEGDLAEASKQFRLYYPMFAASVGVPCFDAASVAAPAPVGTVLPGGGIGDGVHLPADAHLALGEALAAEVKKILRP